MPYYDSQPIYTPPPSKAAGIVVIVTFLVGIAALVAEINLFRLTFISLSRAMAIWTGFSIITFLPHIRLFRPYLSAAKTFMLALFYAYGSAGLLLYGFMAINYYFADAKTTKQTYAVIVTENGTLTGKCVEPYIEIKHKGLNKQIIYPCGTVVNKEKSLTLTISKGFCGYDIIRNQIRSPGKD
jgi:hypothetical protein